ncbi:hypothetical protein V8E53_015489 [Lactarius tabidus]
MWRVELKGVAEPESHTWGRVGGGQIYKKKKLDMGTKLGTCQQMAQFFKMSSAANASTTTLHPSPCPDTPIDASADTPTKNWPNTSTFKIEYTPLHMQIFLVQVHTNVIGGFLPGTNMPDSNFGKCMQCAAIDCAHYSTSLALPRSAFCQACFVQYCFNPNNLTSAAVQLPRCKLRATAAVQGCDIVHDYWEGWPAIEWDQRMCIVGDGSSECQVGVDSEWSVGQRE